LLERGLWEGYPKTLEKRLAVAVSRGKALLTDGAEAEGGLRWIESLCGQTYGRPLVTINRYCIEHGVNALCFSRSSILLCGRGGVFGGLSHNQRSAIASRRHIDSG
jgi:hypothetical protein